MPKKPNVNTPSTTFLLRLPTFHLVADLMGGTAAMRLARKAYLPQEAGESTAQYNVRINRSFLHNMYQRAVDTLTGKVFQKKIALAEDMSEEIKGWCENIDRCGRSLNMFGRDLFLRGVADGHRFFMVDMPDTGGEQSAADETSGEVRPYMVEIDPRDVIFWRSEVIAGREILTHVRIREDAIFPDGEWGNITVPRVRVLDRIVDTETGAVIITWRVFMESKPGADDWAVTDDGVMSNFDQIPLFCFYADREGFLQSTPPLIDLAWLNVEHWQTSSDQRNILKIARVPFVFIKGVPLEKLTGHSGKMEFGSSRAIVAPNGTDADAKFVEHTGKAIAAGRDDIKDIEMRAMFLTMEPQIPHKKVTTTATEAQLDNDAQNSELAVMAQSLNVALNEALQLMARVMGRNVSEAGKVPCKVNDDLSVSGLETLDAAILQAARNARDITQEVFLKEYKRRKLLSEDVDIAKEITLTTAERTAEFAQETKQLVERA